MESTASAVAASPAGNDAQRLSDLSAAQWKSGIAAWLGWLFDGLDMHLYTLVAAPFVAQLLHVADTGDAAVNTHASWIMAAFLVGWALGGAFFGRLGDFLGRSAALSLTILTYATFTGLSAAATSWWDLMCYRFLAALGIGGEWAVGSSLLSETWPQKWRPWVAAVLQTGVNVGILTACATYFLMSRFIPGMNPRYVFLVGIIPALLVFWIRREVPEPEEWKRARTAAQDRSPSVADLFRGSVRRTTLLTMGLCGLSLTAWWAFLFWNVQHVRHLPEFAAMPGSREEVKAIVESRVSVAFFSVILISIGGNFFAGLLAKWLGYRRSIALMFLGFVISFVGAYSTPRSYVSLLPWIGAIGFFSGVFGLFTMYLPPLFPTLLRTTGAGFCFNVGRIVAACGTIVFGLFAQVGDFRLALLWDGMLFLPAIAVALFMPEPGR